MTTYYIHPEQGADDNDGLTAETSWQGFEPLVRVTLQPGDRIEVLAPGALHHTVYLQGGGTATAPVTICFASGRYDVHPDGLLRRQYYISNCNGDPEADKAIAVLAERAHHIVIDGPGATFVCRGKMIELCVDHSENVTVRGLTFDYQRPTVSEFSVSATTEESADLAIHPDSAYAVKNGKITWVGEGWECATGLAQELIPETEEVWRRKDPLLELRVEELEPGVVRAHGSHNMIAGRIFQLRDTQRDCVGAFLRRSHDITLDDVHFAFMHGMGVLCQFTENITLDKVTIAPDEASGRTTAAWADCMHFSGCRGKLVIRDCTFCGAHDDAMNIHGTYLRIVGQVDACRLRAAFVHPQTYGFQAFFPGDEIDYIQADSLACFGTAHVKSVEMLTLTEQIIELSEPVPSEWRDNDVIENVTWTPEVEISGCLAKRIPTRGFLLTSRRRIVVKDNTFFHLHASGVHLASDACDWFESGYVRDMTISGNRFVNCGGPAVSIVPRNSVPNPAVYRDIEIRGNDFVLSDGHPAVDACSTTGLRVTDNRIQAEGPVDMDSVIRTRECDAVTIEGNALS